MPEGDVETASTLPADRVVTLDLRSTPREVMPLRTAAAHERTLEFAAGLSEDQARREASRCLRCDLAYLCPTVRVAGQSAATSAKASH